MMNRLFRSIIIFVIAIAATTVSVHTIDAQDKTMTDSVLFVIPSPTDSELPIAKVDKTTSLNHFAWGLDAGSAVDLTANDMTSINIHGYFGYKGSWLRFIGVGAGINTMISNSSRSYPVYGMLRTSFSRRHQLCFMDLRAGVSFNNILAYPSQTDFYGSLGIGVTLAHGRKFSSHIVLSYDFMPIKPYNLYREIEETTAIPGESFEGEETTATTTRLEPYQQSFPNLHYASIRIGCSF